MTKVADKRVFLGLDRPPLVSAVRWLVDEDRNAMGDKGVLDLRDRLIVVPGSRAGGRMLQLLVAESESSGLQLIPPEIISVGSLPEKLYEEKQLLASDLSQQIAWSKALEASPQQEIESLIGRTEIDSLRDWQPLAAMLSKLHERLGNDIWSFSSVAREVEKLPGFLPEEQARWNALREIQQRYYKILGAAGLWDPRAARSVAARSGGNGNPMCKTSQMVVLIGVADLNKSTTEMLRQVQDQVSVLVATDESLADRFDEFGRIITKQWIDREVRIEESQITFVDQPADQAFAVSSFITALGGKFAADEITVGIPDADIVPQIERSLNSIGATHRMLAGRSLKETSPVRLMTACREYLRNEEYSSLASLIRHPDLFAWLKQNDCGSWWIGALDEFQNEHLPAEIRMNATNPFGDPGEIRSSFSDGDEKSESRASYAARSAEALNKVHELIAGLLSPLTGDDRSLAEWTKAWTNVLTEVYGSRILDKTNTGDQQILRACEVLYGSLADQRQVPEDFGTTTSAIQALDWALEAASESRVAPPDDPEAIELAGWLDLALDDAPVMIITGMNDESVPTSETAHPFLPNGLCEQLEILDNDRRYARDAYALSVMSAVRENLFLISGRRDAKGEPKKPSRLLFATDDDTAAIRARAFFSFEGKPQPRFWLKDEQTAQEEQAFEIPMPVDAAPVNSLSVTYFKEFLKCPYRFYLSRILKLNPMSDRLRELDGGAFGSLAHDVLEAFGKSDIRDSSDAETIREFLSSELDDAARMRFTGTRLPAVRIQVEQLRLRLDTFAIEQAKHRAGGWRIVHVEDLHEHELTVAGKPFTIRGKIDRVDQHETSGQVAVWDYKTSDAGKTPAQMHLSKGEWVDLQLPLYRHLIKEVPEVEGADLSDLTVGYILLPKSRESIGFSPFEIDKARFADADRKAFEIIEQLRQGKFWPLAEKPPMYSEDYAVICQDNVAEKWVDPTLEKTEEAAPW
ncbi:MAG: PD-(D/E)XK nuclease family protein [Planctomycetota bacterium]